MTPAKPKGVAKVKPPKSVRVTFDDAGNIDGVFPARCPNGVRYVLASPPPAASRIEKLREVELNVIQRAMELHAQTKAKDIHDAEVRLSAACFLLKITRQMDIKLARRSIRAARKTTRRKA